jgi:hypothetical protein
MKDRTLKLLLALIAVAMWAIVLRPVWEPGTAKAQVGRQGQKPEGKKEEEAVDPIYSFSLVVENDAVKMERYLNEQGSNGWQAAGLSLLPLGGYQSPQIVVLLQKRAN